MQSSAAGKLPAGTFSVNPERLPCPGCPARGAEALTGTDRARFDEAREIPLRCLDDPPSDHPGFYR